MLPYPNFRLAVLALVALVFALSISCGSDNGGPETPEWAVDTVTAPSHLLSRTPFFPESPVSREDFESFGIKPSIYGPGAMEPGQSFRYMVSIFRCCLVVHPVDVPAEWSVSPEGTARVDEETGFLAIDIAAKHGSTVSLTAKVEGVEEPVARELTVFSSDLNPLIGHWQEDSVGGVRELLFQSDGRYFATWLMLESYVDLIGDYSVDTATGKIELIKKGELRETEGFQGQGDFDIDEHGRLLLAGICPTEPDPENPDCIRRFVRSN